MTLTPQDIEAIKRALQPSFEAINQRLDGHDKKFAAIDDKFESLEQKINQKIDNAINGLRTEVISWFQTLAAHIDGDVISQIDRLNTQVIDLRTQVADLRLQITKIKNILQARLN